MTDTMISSETQTPAQRASGPLTGVRIVEFAGIGPGPFACMMLADMGAEVVTLDRVGAKKNLKSVAGRGRKVVELDLKDKAAIAQVLDLLANADADPDAPPVEIARAHHGSLAREERLVVEEIGRAHV